MAAQHLPPDYECGFCASRTESMRDPRELPCQHVFCLSCIEGYYNQHGSVTCPTCGVTHKSLISENLPRVFLLRNEVESDTLLCTAAHGCRGQTAICYCITCGVKFCVNHQKVHHELYGQSHKVLDIDVYKTSPGIYTKPVCEQHKDVLIKACKKCDRFICNECDVYGADCTDQTQHHFKSLSSLKEEINTYLQNQLQITTDKINVVYDLDKKMWRELDDQEQRCEKLVKQIRKLRKERIRKIKEDSQVLMQKVQGHKSRVTNQVEAFYNSLMLKKDELEKLQTEINRLLNADEHMVEKVKQKKIIPEKLNEVELGECFLSQPQSLIRSSDKSSTILGASLITIPSALKFLSEHETNGACYSAYHRQNGEVLLGTQIGTQLLGGNGETLTNYNKRDTLVTKVIEHYQAIYIMHAEENISKVKTILSSDITKKHELFQLHRTGNSICGMAVSDKFMAVTNPDTNQLILFDFMTKKTQNLDLGFAVYDLQFLPDGNLLTVSGDTLFKFIIDNGNLTLIWACKEIVGSYGLCTDSNGLAYVTTFNNVKAVYIVSPEGELLQTLTHDKLPTNIAGAPSIQDGVLAIPGWDEKKLYLFRLEF